MKMKKLTSTILAMCMIVALASPAFAASTSDSVDANIINGLGIREGSATIAYNPPSETPSIGTFAVTAPTSVAPSSWYGVNHDWTATYYTYSSYIFQPKVGRYLDVVANQKFSVEFYSASGTYLAEVTAGYDSSIGKYASYLWWYTSDADYYIIIRNQSGSPISSNAYYNVF